MKKKNYMGLNIGSSSILVIFIVLCLVTFATLSMVSANADYKLSRRVATRTLAYYDANNEAQEILKTIDNSMREALTTAATTQDYGAELAKMLSETDSGITLGYTEDTITLDYRVHITDSQSLHVTLLAVYPADNNSKRYQIQAWQVENMDSWEPDNSLRLVDPDILD